MKKRISWLIVSAMILGNSAVYASERFVNASCPNNDYVIVVEGKNKANHMVSVRSIYLGEDYPEEIQETYSEEELLGENSPLEFLDIVITDADGNFSTSYKTDGDSGYYLITAISEDGAKQNKLFEYYDPNYINEKIREFSGFIQESKEQEIFEFLERYDEVFEIGNDYYFEMKAEECFSGFAEKLISLGTVADKTALATNIRVATVLLKLANAEIPEMVQSGVLTETEQMLKDIESLGFSGDTLFEKTLSETVTDETRVKILKDFGTVNAKTEVQIKEQIDEKILLGAINYSTWGKIQTVLNDHINLLSKDVNTAYDQLTNSQKSKVAKSLADRTEIFESLSGLETAIKKEINDLKESNQNKGSSGGGGGGSSAGGYSSGGYVAIGATPSAPSVKEQEAKAEGFSDLAQASWAKEAIEALAEKGIVSGKSKTQFAPNDEITREEFLAIVLRAFQLIDASATCDFEDVSEDAWYYSTVASAYHKGITKGMTETVFGSGMKITRQDMCVLAYKAAELAGTRLSAAESEFSDQAEIAAYAKTAVGAMYGAEIVGGMGDNRFAPQETATRAQAAKIIYGLLNLQ